MLFSDVVTTSAAVGATRGRREKTTALADLLRAAAPAEVVPVVAWLSGTPRQGRIGTGWRTLAALEVAPSAVPSWTVQQVDALLDELAGTSGPGSTGRRRDLLARLYGAATADEQQFLHRLLTGELRQGALEGLMVDAVAVASGAGQAAVRRAFMLSGQLPETAATALGGGAEALARIGLQVGRPVRPMLASPGDSLDAALAALGTGVVVEHKLDGARIQVHRRGDEVRVWTRTLREITATVPELVELTRALPCSAVVLDGETLALDDDGRPRAFQDTMSRFGTAPSGGTGAGEGHVTGPADLTDTALGTERGVLLTPFFFDLLHLDGRDLVDEPLETRLDLLAGLLGGDREAPLRMPGVRRPSPEEAAGVLEEALAAGHEGVVVKDLAAPYAAGRRGRSWQKVKPVHTLDLVVLGAEWGYGRRTGSLSNIHLGARDPDGGEPVMVGKTFKGMTDELLAWQTETFPRYARAEAPGVVYLRPELVVEVAVDGAQRSTRYRGGVALRFARVVRYRPDRTPADADSLDAVRALLSG
ncbi:ATP-dependent DNA ligase [Pseudonocardia sp. NPDC049635]|uniref:ATP-dependent DNA ligase n=1 Tax=Pseudonocardia sp. NPDC049635 TaxID=3155506 RepID=UPI0033E368B6